jgi:hypothetical protein
MSVTISKLFIAVDKGYIFIHENTFYKSSNGCARILSGYFEEWPDVKK